MVNPYLEAIADMLDDRKVSSQLSDMMPSQISVPLGFTYKITFDFKIEHSYDADTIFDIPMYVCD